MKKTYPNPYRRDDREVYRILVAIALLIIGTLFIGCDDFTETGMPVTEMNEDAVFEEAGTATAAVTQLYAQLRDAGVLTGRAYGASKMLGLYSDELSWWGAATDDADDYYHNTVAANNATVRDWWNTSYAQIYGANSVLEGLEGSMALDAALKDQLKGEAQFVRALVHFYLLQLHGGIPYITSTDYTVNIKAARMDEAAVYDRIIADLESAATLMGEQYASEGRVRPNAYAAKALLARAYLYNGQWAEASNAASAVLDATELYAWEEDLSGVFLKDSPTVIWQLSPRTAQRNTDEASTFNFTSGPPPQVALSEGQVAAFEAGDLRKQLWTRAITDGSSTWYHSFKYKRNGNSTPQVEYPIVLRLAEQYLIRAEARARLGELGDALDDLNRIRHAAGLGDTAATSQQELVEAVLKERRVELFAEYGHRFMDLKRTGLLDVQLTGVKPSWNSTDRLLPIPLEELNLNPNLLPQNAGY